MSGSRAYINFEIQANIALITVDRPPVNALNLQVLDEIKAVLGELSSTSDLGAVIITGGGGKAFMAGADISMFSEMGREEGVDVSKSTQDVFSTVEAFDLVVIAAVSALALGGGCELALACDIRVAGETAVFGLPEVSLGLLPGAGGTQRLARLIGVGKAKELILTGDPIRAMEAKEIGLIERLAPKGEAVSEARKLAGRILLRAPLAIRNAKKAINIGMNMSLKDGLKMETHLFSELFETQDMKEGLKAFLQKRTPKFIGK